MSRAQYVASLRTEREALASRPDSATRTRRLAEVDAELDRYAAEPADPELEVAATPGPVTTARRRAARKA